MGIIVTVSKYLLGSAVTSDDSVVWYGEDISDFEQKLALLDSREENEGHIDRLLQWNQVFCSTLQIKMINA